MILCCPFVLLLCCLLIEQTGHPQFKLPFIVEKSGPVRGMKYGSGDRLYVFPPRHRDKDGYIKDARIEVRW
jgi:hypothetical protein